MTDRVAEIGRGALSPRQVEALRLVAEGHTDEEIAVLMRISETTARARLLEARLKLDARNRAHLVARGYQAGLLGSAG
ncbi:helix-turn-helix transcriptional regulator [Actinoplanes sp. NBRC 101535]|uniref:response regulator transcription factor n=1 Tax=Actinoplanes sp. NBRC 101535 TaxID=3032196 RepID=UPI002555E1B3|nr:helix-turn-helix transcriptional regulator [Actinoplanes sp. NBRC 101535]